MNPLPKLRIGQGVDVHAFTEGDHVVLSRQQPLPRCCDNIVRHLLFVKCDVVAKEPEPVLVVVGGNWANLDLHGASVDVSHGVASPDQV